jgi:hypothetical protein
MTQSRFRYRGPEVILKPSFFHLLKVRFQPGTCGIPAPGFTYWIYGELDLVMRIPVTNITKCWMPQVLSQVPGNPELSTTMRDSRVM